MQVTKIVHNAKSEYFNSKIAKCTNGKQIFNVVYKLLKINIALPLHTSVSVKCLAKLFSTFFHDKVAKIRKHIDSRTTTHELHSAYSHDV